jgi:1,4-dihydroxy-2-naphthoate octaprenyltransferase
MGNLKHWIDAARLKTLPLALSTPLMGSFLAWSSGGFQWSVFVLATITTLLLQILSNFANDYGDFTSGADNENRIGPERMLQSGKISPRQMKVGLFVTVSIALITGILLIYFGTKGKNLTLFLIFFGLGIAAIAAAIKYTVGKNPYGYIGLGDFFVFLFFGLVGVVGTCYLHTGSFNPWHLLPASAVGLLSSGVLNLNNMRDIDTDKLAKKRTLVVWMGKERAKYYHLALVTSALVMSFFYVVFNFVSAYQFLFLLTIPLFISNVYSVFTHSNPKELYPELKKLALSTFLFTLAFGLGMIL